jgi:chromosome segregation ATPase
MQKIFDLQEKFKLYPLSTVIPSPRYLPNMSPITLSDSHFFSSSFSSSFETKSIQPSKQELLKRLDLVQQESFQTIESSCYIQERLKLLTEEKVSLILKIGNLYQKKQLLAQSQDKHLRYEQDLQTKHSELKKLENHLKSLKEKLKNHQKKNSALIETRLRILHLSERLETKRPETSSLFQKLSDLESSNNLKETYLKTLLSLKSEILSRTGQKK